MLTRLLAVIPLALLSSAVGAQSFDVAAEAETCAACHGEDGVPTRPDAPIIWGQEFYYLYVQLKDYGSGLRAHEIMGPMAANYDKAQQKALAQHFADLPWPDIPTAGVAEVQDAARSVIAAGECSQCHNSFAGDSRIPRLAGQTESYLEQTLLNFKNRVRMNAPDKAFLMESFGGEQLTVVARYLSAL